MRPRGCFGWIVVGAVSLVLWSSCAPSSEVRILPAVQVDGYEAAVVVGPQLRRQSVRCPGAASETDIVYHELRVWLDDGSEAVMYRPTPWNGDLVLYAHGYMSPDEPVGLPDPLPPPQVAFRDAMMCRGYAAAASSYARNGFAVEEGVRDTHLLNGMFAEAFGPPEHTIVMGESLGALVAVELVERYPDTYDGALPMCGILGGAVPQLNYLANVALVFRALYPDVLGPVAFADDLFDLSHVEGVPVEEVQDAIAAAIRADPSGMATMRDLVVTLRHPFDSEGCRAAPMPLLQVAPDATLDEAIEALQGAMGYYLVGIEDAVARGMGSPLENVRVSYASQCSASTDYRVELGLPVFEPDAGALRYFACHYQPTGLLHDPVITLHNQYDPHAPLAHEDIYRGLVAAAGGAEWLRSVTLEGTFGHCVFGLDDVMSAIEALSRWIETGTPPEFEGVASR